MSPLVSQARHLGLIEARAYQQLECFQAAQTFARAEGIVPAPESSHAVRAAIDEAERCTREGKEEVILFNLSGHGHFDMQAYTDYFAGQLNDLTYDESLLADSLARLPKVTEPA
jgi:tryptophan synthase beta chain